MKKNEIVKLLVERKIVDFKKVGELISEKGESFALDGEPLICGTGPHYIHIYKFPSLGDIRSPQESFEGLAKIGTEIR